MKELLLEMKKYAETTAFPLPTQKVSTFEKGYQEVLILSYQENPFELSFEKKCGRQKLTKPLNLLNRFRDYEEEGLEFLYQKDVPFDNNLAERDIRITMVKQKISRCLRNDEGAQIFCRVQGYISTVPKQKLNILTVIE